MYVSPEIYARFLKKTSNETIVKGETIDKSKETSHIKGRMEALKQESRNKFKIDIN